MWVAITLQHVDGHSKVEMNEQDVAGTLTWMSDYHPDQCLVPGQPRAGPHVRPRSGVLPAILADSLYTVQLDQERDVAPVFLYHFLEPIGPVKPVEYFGGNSGNAGYTCF